MPDFAIKRGDRSPSWEYTLKFAGDLTGASVKLIAVPESGGAPIVNRTATIVDEGQKRIRFDWGPGETAVAGDYYAEWEVTLANGNKQSFPVGTFLDLTIHPDLGDEVVIPPVIGGIPGLGKTDTRASMQALALPSNGLHVYVGEVDAVYKFVAGSAAAADSWTVLTANDATPGRWLLQGDTISLAPLGGTSDDWPRLFAAGGAAAAMAYKGTIVLRPGTWNCKTVQAMPSGTNLRGSAGVTIVQALTDDGSPFTAAFSAQYGTITTATTLNADANRGSFSIVTAASAPFAVGELIRISNAGSAGNTAGLRVSTHTVVAVAGVNANLDRPLPRDYKTGDNVVKIASMVQDIHIDGGGMVMTGTGVRLVELMGARRCSVKRVAVNDSQGIPSDLLMSFDVGGYDCCYEDISIAIKTATPVAGIAFESTDRCVANRVRIDGNFSYGIGVLDCSDVVVSQSVVSRCANTSSASGFFLASDTTVHAATTEGCISCSVVDSSAFNCGYGFVVRDGGRDNSFRGCWAESNINIGIALGVKDGDSSAPDSNQAIGCTTRRNTSYGLVIGTSAKRSKVVGLDFSNNGSSAATGTGILAQASLDASDLMSSGGNGLQLITATGGVVRIARLSAVHTQVVNVVIFSGTTRATLQDSDLACAASSNAVNSSDVLYVSGCKITGSANALVVSSNILTVGPNCDLSGNAAAFLVNAGALVVEQGGASVSKAVTTADVTLTFAEAQTSRSITTTGVLTGNRNLILPTVNGMAWDVFCNNTGAFTTTFKTAAGTGVVVAQTKRARLMCDGTNIVRVTADV